MQDKYRARRDCSRGVPPERSLFQRVRGITCSRPYALVATVRTRPEITQRVTELWSRLRHETGTLKGGDSSHTQGFSANEAQE